ncbi:MerR family transcriptional regulator [Nocardiopsis suaedae]|uniref:MerR family transcriptional regulator n=1 Tax=Nocardiopsis suaedae TaxID=3018444 RepID=A0ABT4TPC0_9ACTN|nr:MerR family transcriptional regulator [Nocardiopsis suaedae]MDA2806535.1 MerR family transcriptional regulator [Nocardiopsis suaedae]
MDLVPIGEAARRFGLRTSALRYYEQRGLLEPATRRQGVRMYGRRELRRLALLQIAQRLGISLQAVGAVLDEDGGRWRAAVSEQITALEELIARAEAAKSFLLHARMCPAEHPVGECPHIIRTLDRLVDGDSLEEIAQEHTGG